MLGFYTRLPVVFRGGEARAFADSQWAAPLAGAVVGLICGVGLWVSVLLGLPATVAAALALALGVALTGALHEDGLADTADGFGGGRSREEKLAIMRDSRSGAFGVVAICLSLLIRWAALAALAASPEAALAALVAAHAGSRAVLPAMLAALPPARADGLGSGAGDVGTGTALAALAIGFAALLPGGPAFALAAALVLGLAAFAIARLARSQIGGQTGDVLGAAQQLGEIAVLVAASALLIP
jgi:adenosylcobinamide-GDP ribazoletransferase